VVVSTGPAPSRSTTWRVAAARGRGSPALSLLGVAGEKWTRWRCDRRGTDRVVIGNAAGIWVGRRPGDAGGPRYWTSCRPCPTSSTGPAGTVFRRPRLRGDRHADLALRGHSGSQPSASDEVTASTWRPASHWAQPAGSCCAGSLPAGGRMTPGRGQPEHPCARCPMVTIAASSRSRPG